MKIAFLGDSITEGGGSSCEKNRYVNKVSEILGIETLNYGISGTRIAKQMEKSEDPSYDKDFIDRVDQIDKNCSFVFVFGGTNDYGHGFAPIGDALGEDLDPYNFCGAVRLLISKIENRFGKGKMCFILPLRRFGDENICGEGKKPARGTLENYVEMIKYIATKHGIDYIDLYNNGFEKPLVCTGDDLTIDGLHPNDKGHLLVAKKVCEYIVSKKELYNK